MVITHTTIEAIDAQTLKGLPIGHYGKQDNTSELPRVLGDWNIRAICEKRCPGTGYIVAVPSNSRTRHIYVQGRTNWLKALGYTEEVAQVYIKASWVVSRKWDHAVALFVLDHLKIDDYILDEMLVSNNPKKVGERYEIHTRSPRSIVLAGCQILKNMRSL